MLMFAVVVFAVRERRDRSQERQQFEAQLSACETTIQVLRADVKRANAELVSTKKRLDHLFQRPRNAKRQPLSIEWH